MIILIFLVEAIVGGALVCALSPLAWWWLPVFAVGGFLSLEVLYLITLFIVSLFLGFREAKRDNRFLRGITVRSIGWILDNLRVRVKIEGKEKLPDTPMILVSNHRSDFDPMAAMVALPRRRLAYISKPSNLDIPIAGPFVRRCSFLPIDRENPRSALKTLKRGAALLREQGLDIGIYPEGTRSHTGGPLPFKEGAFLMAKWADAPIVLMTTEGTERIAGHVIVRRNTVRLTIVDVIPREDVEALSVKELTARAEKTLYAALNVSPATGKNE